MKKTSRTLKFHQLSWGTRNFTFEQAVTNSFENLLDPQKRIFENSFFNEYLFFSASPKSENDGIFVRVFECPKDGLHDIDLAAQDDARCLGDIDGDDGRRIVSDQIIFWIKDNNIVSCNIGNKTTTLENLFRKLFESANLPEDTYRFRFLDVPNKEILGEIKRHGVRKFDLDISAFIASLPDEVLPKSLGFWAIFLGKRSSPAHEAANRKANLSVRTQFRGAKLSIDDIAEDDFMKELAISAIEEDQITGYKFILGNGRPIDSENIRVIKKVKISSSRNVYDYFNARSEISQFTDELRTESLLP
jgi:hypothetical protein